MHDNDPRWNTQPEKKDETNPYAMGYYKYEPEPSKKPIMVLSEGKEYTKEEWLAKKEAKLEAEERKLEAEEREWKKTYNEENFSPEKILFERGEGNKRYEHRGERSTNDGYNFMKNVDTFYKAGMITLVQAKIIMETVMECAWVNGFDRRYSYDRVCLEMGAVLLAAAQYDHHNKTSLFRKVYSIFQNGFANPYKKGWFGNSKERRPWFERIRMQEKELKEAKELLEEAFN
jgi:hypothetical protein